LSDALLMCLRQGRAECHWLPARLAEKVDAAIQKVGRPTGSGGSGGAPAASGAWPGPCFC